MSVQNRVGRCYRRSVERYICIHGHFYQPPRENPWLEAIELQDSAYPFHDWNERITAECYAPNAASRILDDAGYILRIRNNYARISFNFGPTLLSWMARHQPETYESILAADRQSRSLYHGHGSALAQAYNHMILPLANARDRRTQVLWGLRDFQFRFGRLPEGMWLPETAANTESLEALADAGIAFTILSQSQARRVRRLGGKSWRDIAAEDRIDSTRAYRAHLPSGRTLALFFYDGAISRGVAFEGLLSNGERFARRIAGGFDDERTWPQLMHIATDGESYGHHHASGDMALAYALYFIEQEKLAHLTNYGEFLEHQPPTHEVEIWENSSWSCAHGIERWRSDCGCHVGHDEWNQAWRAPLRESLDWLRDRVAPLYEEHLRPLLRDPWAARDAYIDVVLDRSPASLQRFFDQHALHPLSPEERRRALQLLELQRHAMLMYTSCGWFFDEISGIESVQVLQYAGRVIQLGESLFDLPLEGPFLGRLEHARSNVPEMGDGRSIYERFVRPAIVDLHKVGAHYAVSSLFEEYGPTAQVYAYHVDREAAETRENGRMRLAMGRARVTSDITGESADVSYGVLHLGDHNINGGVRDFQCESDFDELKREVTDAFDRADLPDLIRSVDRNFGAGTYTLKFLFRDEQRKILDRILDSDREEVEGVFRAMYEEHASLLRFLHDLGIPAPRRLQVTAELAVRIQLQHALRFPQFDAEHVERLVQKANQTGVELKSTGDLGFTLAHSIERLARRVRVRIDDLDGMRNWLVIIRLARSLPFTTNLWQVQNIYYDMALVVLPLFRRQAHEGSQAAQDWLDLFGQIGDVLAVRLPPEAAVTGTTAVT